MILQSLDEFIQRFSDSLPLNLHDFKSEFRAELYRGIALALQNLNLVTREEFDSQTAMLTQLRHKLEILEQEVLRLEKQFSKEKDPLDQ